MFLTNGDPKASEINNHVSMNTYGSTTLLDALIYTKFTVRKLIEHNPDLVITRDSYLALICALFRKTVILEVHQSYKSWRARSLFFLSTRFKQVKLAPISRAMLNYLGSSYGFAETRMLVAHSACDGLDPARFDDVSAKDAFSDLGVSISQISVIHAGSFSPSRGSDIFVSLAEKFQDITFVQIGGNKDLVTEYEQQYGYLTNLHFLPHQNHQSLKLLLSKATLLFHSVNQQAPNFWCCSSMKLFDYLEAGRPILSSCVGSTWEILEPGKFIEFEQLDAESAAKALESSINELEYWNIIAKELGTKARHYWTWEARAKAFLEFGRVSLRQNQG